MKSESTFDSSSSDASIYLGSYVALSLFNSGMSFWFVPMIRDYAGMVKKAEDFKIAMRDAARKASEENDSFFALI